MSIRCCALPLHFFRYCCAVSYAARADPPTPLRARCIRLTTPFMSQNTSPSQDGASHTLPCLAFDAYCTICFVVLVSQPKHIVFPKAMHVSRNHYKKSWSLKTFRRIKNVIVLMDWVPDVTALKPEPPPVGRTVSCLCIYSYIMKYQLGVCILYIFFLRNSSF